MHACMCEYANLSVVCVMLLLLWVKVETVWRRAVQGVGLARVLGAPRTRLASGSARTARCARRFLPFLGGEGAG